MSEDEKQAIRQQRREAYRIAKDDLRHREQQIKHWAEGFDSIAEALRSERPDRMVFVGDAEALRPGDNAIAMTDVPTKERLQFTASKVVTERSRVAALEQDLRGLGEWPVD